MPAGEYTLTVDLKSSKGRNTKLYSKIGDQTNGILNSVPFNSWETCSVNNVVPSHHAKVQLGISASATIEIDNFKLMKMN